MFANGQDTLFSSENIGLSILCMVLVRPMRILHAAAFNWAMGRVCVLVERKRERRRLKHDEKERNKYYLCT